MRFHFPGFHTVWGSALLVALGDVADLVVRNFGEAGLFSGKMWGSLANFSRHGAFVNQLCLRRVVMITLCIDLILIQRVGGRPATLNVPADHMQANKEQR